MVGPEPPLIAGRGYFRAVPLHVAPDLGDTVESREEPSDERLWASMSGPVTVSPAGYLRMTKFFGTLFLINFPVGVVTGIVEEFQFGMNWSATLLITHELDGLDQVDEIVVFDHGRVAERGTHAQLIPSGGAYHRLWQAGHPGRPA